MVARKINDYTNDLLGDKVGKYIHVIITNDNCYDCAILTYMLLDENGQPIHRASINVTGNTYQNWDGNNDFPYEHVASAVGFTLVVEEEE